MWEHLTPTACDLYLAGMMHTQRASQDTLDHILTKKTQDNNERRDSCFEVVFAWHVVARHRHANHEEIRESKSLEEIREIHYVQIIGACFLAKNKKDLT